MPNISALGVHVTDQILAVLNEASPLPLSTRQIEERTGYGVRYGQLTYRMLQRLARRGEVEKWEAARSPWLGGSRCCYWRRLRGEISDD